MQVDNGLIIPITDKSASDGVKQEIDASHPNLVTVPSEVNCTVKLPSIAEEIKTLSEFKDVPSKFPNNGASKLFPS